MDLIWWWVLLLYLSNASTLGLFIYHMLRYHPKDVEARGE